MRIKDFQTHTLVSYATVNVTNFLMVSDGHTVNFFSHNNPILMCYVLYLYILYIC